MENTTRGTVAYAKYENDTILGIDPSLNSTGICVFKGDTLVRCHRVVTGLTGIDRIGAIRNYLHSIIAQNSIKAASIEGYVYGRSMMVTNSFELHELGGVLKLLMRDVGIPYYVFAPTSVKKFVTGNARKVKKEDMLEGISKTWNLHFSKKQNDLADAYAMGKLCYFTHVMFNEKDIPVSTLFGGTLTTYQLDVLKGIKTRAGL